MKIKQRFQNYLKKKTLWGKITDVLLIALIVAMLIPSSRLAVGGFVNRIKAMVMQPSVEQKGNEQKMSPEDFKWQINTIEGNPILFKSFEGKVIFLNFWATWCPPCVGEMPEIQGLYDFYKDNTNIAFIMVSNEEPEPVKNFIEKRNYTFPVYTSKYRAPEIFYSQSIPVTFLIAKDGRIVIREVGATKWNGKKMRTIIESLINE